MYAKIDPYNKNTQIYILAQNIYNKKKCRMKDPDNKTQRRTGFLLIRFINMLLLLIWVAWRTV